MDRTTKFEFVRFLLWRKVKEQKAPQKLKSEKQNKSDFGISPSPALGNA